MSLFGVAVRNVGRNWFRTLLTMLGVAVAMLAFVLLRTVLSAWMLGAEHAAQDRVASRHKITYVMNIPRRYVDEIRQMPGVQGASHFNWFGGRLASDENAFFANMATDPATFFDVYDEVSLADDARRAWIEDRQGAIIGAQLARQFGWKVGDRVTLTGTIYPGEWPVTVRGIYTTTRKSIDQSSMFFHWKYINESPVMLPQMKDQVGWVIAKVKDAGAAAGVARAIDQHFDAREIQTLSMSERALYASFMGMLGALLRTVDVVSLVILVIMMLILGNTIAMGVRERTQEYGVLRAIGFRPGHLAGLVLGEGGAVGLTGGLAGIVVCVPLINQALGPFMEDTFTAFFPYFRLQPKDVAFAVVAVAVGAAAAAAIPAWRASRLDVIDALRRVG